MQSTPMLFLSYIYSLVLYCVLCYTGCIHIVYFKFILLLIMILLADMFWTM